MLSDEMLAIAEENLQAHIEIEKEEEEIKSLIKPLQIWITRWEKKNIYEVSLNFRRMHFFLAHITGVTIWNYTRIPLICWFELGSGPLTMSAQCII